MSKHDSHHVQPLAERTPKGYVGQHRKPIEPHTFTHPHDKPGLTCRCIKMCRICGLIKSKCQEKYGTKCNHCNGTGVIDEGPEGLRKCKNHGDFAAVCERSDLGDYGN